MKSYEEPKVNVILFDDHTYVANGIGTLESSYQVGNNPSIPIKGAGDQGSHPTNPSTHF